MAKLYAYNLISEKHLADVGHVAIQSAELEFTLDAVLVDILKLQEDTSETLITSRHLSWKLQLLKKLVNERFPVGSPDIIARFNNLFTRYESAVRERNILIHGRWIRPDQATAPAANANMPQSYHKSSPPMFADKAAGTAQNLADFEEELRAFCLLHGDKLK